MNVQIKVIIFIDKEKGKASEGLNRFLQCTALESFLFVCFKEFIYLWLCWVFIAVRAFSLLEASGGFSIVPVYVSYSLWQLLLWRPALGHVGFSSFGGWALELWPLGSRAQAQSLWCTGLAALWYVGSSQTSGGTPISSTGRWILHHGGTRLSVSIYRHMHLSSQKTCTMGRWVDRDQI